MSKIYEYDQDSLGRYLLPDESVPIAPLDKEHARVSTLRLPTISETGLSRHYTYLSNRIYGVNHGFYPLGSCTMKYNPKLNDEMANLEGFTKIHPLAKEKDIQGCLKIMTLAEEYLCEITGMEGMSLQPAAGSQGELAGLLIMKAYHKERNDNKRTKIIIPDSAHGTNPASAAVAGFEVINIPSTIDGYVDLDALKSVIGEDTAGFMITNPNTLGLFDKNILDITRLIHEVGGLNYYDGANMNAILGIVKPGDMGFDVIHLNLHKTFSTPHGGGGPGCGPVGCKEFLVKYLPGRRMYKEGEGIVTYQSEHSIGAMKSFHGHFLVVVRALTYILTLGRDGLKSTSYGAILNANYLQYSLRKLFKTPNEGVCMHEFIISAAKLKEAYGVTALDIAKTILDYGIHPPTMYFPLIVPEALMIEPTETEDKNTLDEVIEIFEKIYKLAVEEGDTLKLSPKTTVIGRPDEVNAARNPKVKYNL